MTLIAPAFATDAETTVPAGALAYEQALMLLHRGETARAQHALERVVLHNPAHAGAWLDLALTSAQLGDFKAAIGYAKHVLTFPEPPPVAQSTAKELIAQLEHRVRQHTGGVRLMFGRSSNANGGTDIDQIGLTTDTGRLFFELADSAKAEPAAFTQISTHFQTRSASKIDTGPLYTVTTNFRRFTNDQPLQYQLQGLVSDENGAWQYGARAALARPDDKLDYGRAGGWVQHHLTPKTSLGFSADYYHHWTLEELDTTSLSLNGTWAPSSHSLLRFAMGRDIGRNDRTGGDQTRLEVSAIQVVELPMGKLTAQADIEWIKDSDGYNPLLEHNARRTLKRNTLEVNYSLPLTPRLHLHTGATVWKQSSNIELFRSRGLIVQAGLNWTF